MEYLYILIHLSIKYQTNVWVALLLKRVLVMDSFNFGLRSLDREEHCLFYITTI